MKRYQIAVLFFAIGIFTITSIVVFLASQQNEVKTPEPEKEYSSVMIFFSNSIQDPQGLYCDKTYPVERAVSMIPSSDKGRLGELAYLALSELLKGPASYEKASGYYTSINDGTIIKSIGIVNGVATVDFNGKLDEGIGGSCKVQAIRSQITETLKQFPEISDVIISVNGESETILQP